MGLLVLLWIKDLTLNPRLRQGNAVTAALLELFLAFAAQEAERGRADGRRLIVDPTRLREALAAYKAAAFRIGASQATGILTFQGLGSRPDRGPHAAARGAGRLQGGCVPHRCVPGRVSFRHAVVELC